MLRCDMSRTIQVKGNHPQGLALVTRIYLMQLGH